MNCVRSRGKSGRLLEMTSNFLGGVSWKQKFFSIEAKSRVLTYYSVGKKCITKHCSFTSDIPGGYCSQCIKKFAGEEESTSGKKRPSTSKLNGLVKRPPSNGRDSMFKNDKVGASEEKAHHTIPLARATVMTLPPKKAGGKCYCFVVTPYHSKREYVLQAADEQEMNEWVELLIPRTKMEVNSPPAPFFPPFSRRAIPSLLEGIYSSGAPRVTRPGGSDGWY